MGCPKCQCEEISPSGMCLWCGYQMIASGLKPEPASEEKRDFPDSSEVNASSDSTHPVEEERPEWRQGPSQRLNSIKQKRDTSEHLDPAQSAPLLPAEPESPPTPAVPAESKQPAARSQDTQDAQELIDNRTIGQAQHWHIPSRKADRFIQSPTIPDQNASLMLLLARALSGLVDTVIIFLSTGFLLLVADVFSGISILGLTSVFNYAVLLLLVYFFYSLFFFGVSNQTIGMMMLNLRLVTDNGEERPKIARVLARCFGCLLSILCLGAGLLWAFFDGDRKFFHDRLANTRVVRA